MNKTITTLAILSAVLAIGTTALSSLATAPAYGQASSTGAATSQGTTASAASATQDSASSASCAEELGFRSAHALSGFGNSECHFDP
jgi:hypothetical protein